MEPNNAVE